MARYAETTSVPIARTREQIDRLLRAWGCDAIRWTDDIRNARVQLDFVWERLHGSETVEPVAYVARITVALPSDDDLRVRARDGRSGRFSEPKYRKLCDERGRQELRILLLWITAALNAVEAGIVSPETVFLPFLVGTDGQTVAEAALPRLPKLLRGAARSVLNLPESAGA